MQRNDGFGFLVAILVVTLAILVGGGIVIWQSMPLKNAHSPKVVLPHVASISASPASTTVAQDMYAGWKNYENSSVGYGFRYPANWLVHEYNLAEGPLGGTSYNLDVELEDALGHKQMSIEVAPEVECGGDYGDHRSFDMEMGGKVQKVSDFCGGVLAIGGTLEDQNKVLVRLFNDPPSEPKEMLLILRSLQGISFQ